MFLAALHIYKNQNMFKLLHCLVYHTNCSGSVGLQFLIYNSGVIYTCTAVIECNYYTVDVASLTGNDGPTCSMVGYRQKYHYELL